MGRLAIVSWLLVDGSNGQSGRRQRAARGLASANLAPYLCTERPETYLSAASREHLLKQKALPSSGRAINWVQGLDLNQRPSGYE